MTMTFYLLAAPEGDYIIQSAKGSVEMKSIGIPRLWKSPAKALTFAKSWCDKRWNLAPYPVTLEWHL